jgi:hypothetical protein
MSQTAIDDAIIMLSPHQGSNAEAMHLTLSPEHRLNRGFCVTCGQSYDSLVTALLIIAYYRMSSRGVKNPFSVSTYVPWEGWTHGCNYRLPHGNRLPGGVRLALECAGVPPGVIPAFRRDLTIIL